MEKFNLKLVHDNFLTALVEEDDVKLQEYLDSYEELNKFFNEMGTMFSFVSNDLKSKIDILYEFLKNQAVCENFVTVKKMLEYEKNNALLAKKGYVSGSRTLLRLHRGLDFIRTFLKSLSELKDSDNTTAACKAAYEQTLSRHHTFIVRNGAKLAMHAMPNREQLLKRVCGEDEEKQRTLDILPKMLDIAGNVYERIEKLYTLYDLHSLP